MSKLKELLEKRKADTLNWFFGENNYSTTSKRFAIKKHVLNDDEIVICTNNVTYWKNKDQFVLWVSNNKIVYLKNFQVMPVYNFEVFGDTSYLVKLNRKYFKEYKCFETEEFDFGNREDTFDSLKEIAKQQDKHELWFKPGEDKYGNKCIL